MPLFVTDPNIRQFAGYGPEAIDISIVQKPSSGVATARIAARASTRDVMKKKNSHRVRPG
jgi:hypothetical protein